MLRENKLVFIVIFWLVVSVGVFAFIIFSDHRIAPSVSQEKTTGELSTTQFEAMSISSLQKEISLLKTSLSRAMKSLDQYENLLNLLDEDIKRFLRQNPAVFEFPEPVNRISNANTFLKKLKANVQCSPGFAVVAVMRQEEHYIQEWIVHHLAIGAEHIILYDNSASAEESNLTARLLSPFLELKLVTVIEHPPPESELSGFNASLSLPLLSTFDWVAFLNIDEFLILHENQTRTRCIRDFLKNYNHYGGVVVHWAFFCDDGKIQRNVSEFVMESFEYRWRVNAHIKTIARPNRVSRFTNTHFAEFKPPYFAVNVEHTRVDGALDGKTHLPYKLLQLNHYWTKSYKEWLRKMLRGYLGTYGGPERKLIEFQEHCRAEEMNYAILDATAKRNFLPLVQYLLAENGEEEAEM